MYLTPPRRRQPTIWRKVFNAVSDLANSLFDIPSKLFAMFRPPTRDWTESNEAGRWLRPSRANLHPDSEVRRRESRQNSQNEFDFDLYGNGSDLRTVDPSSASMNKFARNLIQRPIHVSNLYHVEQKTNSFSSSVVNPNRQSRHFVRQSEVDTRNSNQNRNNCLNTSHISNRSFVNRPSDCVRNIPPVIQEESNSTFTFKKSSENGGSSITDDKNVSRMNKGKKMPPDEDMFHNQPMPKRTGDISGNDLDSYCNLKMVISKSKSHISVYSKSLVDDYQKATGVEIVKRKQPVKDIDQVLGQINRQYLQQVTEPDPKEDQSSQRRLSKESSVQTDQSRPLVMLPQGIRKTDQAFRKIDNSSPMSYGPNDETPRDNSIRNSFLDKSFAEGKTPIGVMRETTEMNQILVDSVKVSNNQNLHRSPDFVIITEPTSESKNQKWTKQALNEGIIAKNSPKDNKSLNQAKGNSFENQGSPVTSKAEGNEIAENQRSHFSFSKGMFNQYKNLSNQQKAAPIETNIHLEEPKLESKRTDDTANNQLAHLDSTTTKGNQPEQKETNSSFFKLSSNNNPNNGSGSFFSKGHNAGETQQRSFFTKPTASQNNRDKEPDTETNPNNEKSDVNPPKKESNEEKPKTSFFNMKKESPTVKTSPQQEKEDIPASSQSQDKPNSPPKQTEEADVTSIQPSQTVQTQKSVQENEKVSYQIHVDGKISQGDVGAVSSNTNINRVLSMPNLTSENQTNLPIVAQSQPNPFITSLQQTQPSPSPTPEQTQKQENPFAMANQRPSSVSLQSLIANNQNSLFVNTSRAGPNSSNGNQQSNSNPQSFADNQRQPFSFANNNNPQLNPDRPLARIGSSSSNTNSNFNPFAPVNNNANSFVPSSNNQANSMTHINSNGQLNSGYSNSNQNGSGFFSFANSTASNFNSGNGIGLELENSNPPFNRPQNDALENYNPLRANTTPLTSVWNTDTVNNNQNGSSGFFGNRQNQLGSSSNSGSFLNNQSRLDNMNQGNHTPNNFSGQQTQSNFFGTRQNNNSSMSGVINSDRENTSFFSNRGTQNLNNSFKSPPNEPRNNFGNNSTGGFGQQGHNDTFTSHPNDRSFGTSFTHSKPYTSNSTNGTGQNQFNSFQNSSSGMTGSNMNAHSSGSNPFMADKNAGSQVESSLFGAGMSDIRNPLDRPSGRNGNTRYNNDRYYRR